MMNLQPQIKRHYGDGFTYRWLRHHRPRFRPHLWGQRITPVIISDTLELPILMGGNSGAIPAVPSATLNSALNSNTNPEIYAALGFRGPTQADDIYRVECGFWGAAGNVSPFDVDPEDRVDFCSLEVYGNVIIAGTYEVFADPTTPTEVWYSLNDGTTWRMASKNPTGELRFTCRVLISKYGSTAGLAFAATGGAQSAVSISDDNGDTWMQVAFIDDEIIDIKDIAFDPTSDAALLITTNDDYEDSLWKVADVTALVPFWQRTLCTGYSTDIVVFTMVEYSNDGVAIMLYSYDNAAIFRSTNDTRSFSNWRNTASWGTSLIG